MSKSTPLQAGDRVAVYRGGVRGTGRVTHAMPDIDKHGGIWVELDKRMLGEDRGTGLSLFVSPKQCRRLKKKPRPQKERPVRWLAKTTETEFVYQTEEAAIRAHGSDVPIWRMLATRKCEVPVSREALAKAWDLAGPRELASESQFFGLLAKALRFPEVK